MTAVQKRIPAAGAIGVEILIVGHQRCERPRGGGGEHGRGGRVVDRAMADFRRRGLGTAADARRAHHADIGTAGAFQIGNEFLGALHFANQAVANPDGNLGRRDLAFAHHVEMRIKRRHFVDRGLRQTHLFRERGEMGQRQMTKLVLDQVQVFDQQVGRAFSLAEQGANLVARRGLDHPAARMPATVSSLGSRCPVVGSNVGSVGHVIRFFRKNDGAGPWAPVLVQAQARIKLGESLTFQ